MVTSTLKRTERPILREENIFDIVVVKLLPMNVNLTKGRDEIITYINNNALNIFSLPLFLSHFGNLYNKISGNIARNIHISARVIRSVWNPH